ncbi:MAG: hypothetical protein KBT27_13255 [Prevotellaceae bacterium]|nr:hypothetical protein [Candidatus Faecinaster equi]
MKIENNITTAPNTIEFMGDTYDIQLNMYVISQFEDFNTILNDMGNIETAFKMLTAMMNSDTIKNKKDRPLLDSDYVAANTSMQEMPKYSNAIAIAMGYEAPTETESEIDKALECENLPENEKN